jgi:hypothetical protein
MALKKQVTLPSQAVGEYWRITSFRWDADAREASALIDLYVSAAARQAGASPVRKTLAKLRLTGADFDAFLSTGALAAADGDVVAQLYLAAKSKPAVCDLGGDVLHNAEDI